MEDYNLLPDVSAFIVKFIALDATTIIYENTKIEEDIGITGDDAYEFIIAYGKFYNVDISNFLLADYFHGEGSYGFTLFYGHSSRFQKSDKKEFVVGYLIKGIQAGKLDERVINSKDKGE